jgi:RNase H-fold protein (predicted Holliday junction resolvase)
MESKNAIDAKFIIAEYRMKLEETTHELMLSRGYIKYLEEKIKLQERLLDEANTTVEHTKNV